MQKHIDDLATRRATVDNKPATVILDRRVLPGGAADAPSLITQPKLDRQDFGVTITPPWGAMLEFVVPLESMDPVALARVCVRIALGAGVPRAELRPYGQSISDRELQSELKARKTFLIEAEGFAAHLACATNFRLGCLRIKGLPEDTEIECANAVVAVSRIISIRWVDAEYDFWQNVEDPRVFRAAGRSMAGLPTRSNDLPPPFEHMVIDTSRNPGRRIPRGGYIEAIGHRMWLGSEFFVRVPGSSREAVLSASWLQVSKRAGDLLKIMAHDAPFWDTTTVDVQERLRRLLFPIRAPQ